MIHCLMIDYCESNLVMLILTILNGMINNTWTPKCFARRAEMVITETCLETSKEDLQLAKDQKSMAS